MLELIKEFSKIAGYKINVQKPVAFLYTNSELARKEIKKTITFSLTPKRIKYLRVSTENLHLSESKLTGKQTRKSLSSEKKPEHVW